MVDSNLSLNSLPVLTRTIFHKGRRWLSGIRKLSTERFLKAQLTTSSSTRLHFSWLVFSRCPTLLRYALRTFSPHASSLVITCVLRPFLSLNMTLTINNNQTQFNQKKVAVRRHSTRTLKKSPTQKSQKKQSSRLDPSFTKKCLEMFSQLN